MPHAISQAQHRLAVEELRKLDAGAEPRTSMTRDHLQELADTPDVHLLPERATKEKR